MNDKEITIMQKGSSDPCFSHKMQIADLKKENADLKMQLENKNSLINVLECDISNNNMNFSNLEKENAELKIVNNQLFKDVEDMRSVAESLEVETINVNFKNDALIKENAELKKELEISGKDIDFFSWHTKEVGKLKKEFGVYKKGFEGLLKLVNHKSCMICSLNKYCIFICNSTIKKIGCNDKLKKHFLEGGEDEE